MCGLDARKILVVIGPTSVGKTQVVLDLVRSFPDRFEIVSCDSMQVYKYMDIGSAKPSKEELDLVPHHLIDVVDPVELKNGEFFTVANYSTLARKAIDEILDRRMMPLVTGGTGLYLDSIIYDMDFAAAPKESVDREELYKIAEEEGPDALHDILKKLDLDAAERIHPNNVKRVVRAIEAARLGEKVKEFKKDFDLNPKYDPIMIGLSRDRDKLYDRINQRVDILMDKGLLEEVEKLVSMGLDSNDYSMKGIGYKELIDYLDNKCTLEEAVEAVKTNTRHYAKRQITWFKKYENMKWFHMGDVPYEETISEIEEWLKTNL